MLRIEFGLGFMKSGKPLRGAFKHAAALDLFDEYRERISKFTPCEASGIERVTPEAGTRLWVCDRSAKAKVLSSEDVAAELNRCMDQGVKRLGVIIGGPNGIAPAELEKLRPALLWSFGKMTLPHELAAVVAAEQMYRAFTILKGLPYHSGH